MLNAPTSNIVHSSKWNKEEWLTYFQHRLSDMKSKRAETVEKEWADAENQVTNISYYNNDGELEVNVPMESNLIEIYMGRTNGKIDYDIIPDGQTDVEQLQPSKYALNFFLDGNKDFNFWKENKTFRNLKATYGTGVWSTVHRCHKDYSYKIKEDIIINSEKDLLNEKNFDKVENETYYFFPQNIHCRDFYIDDGAYGEQDLQKADDCILKERLSWMQYKLRYGDLYDIDETSQGVDDSPKNINDTPVQQEYVILHHYYHKITKKYLVIANEETVIYNGIYLYDDGKLPFDTVQHYTNINRIRGDGLPKRVGYLKAYKSEILQDILVGASMSSGLHLLVGNDDEIGQNWNFGGRKINILRTTGGVESVQPVNTSPNLGFFTTVLSIIDELVVQDTGDNPKAPFQAQTDKVGIQEIIEANKIVRQSSVDENYNVGLDNVLTMTLARIKQFAPSLLSEKIYSKDGTLLKVIFPKIRMDNYKIEKKGKETSIVEAIGKYGYFDLKPDVIQGLGVKITTSSTNSILPIIERQKITEYVNNIVNIGSLAQMDQTGEMMRKLSERIKFDDLLGWIGDVYGYDVNGLKANTEKDKIAKKNIEKIKLLKDLMLNMKQNANIQQPMENQGLGQATGGQQEIAGGELQSQNATPNTSTPLQGI